MKNSNQSQASLEISTNHSPLLEIWRSYEGFMKKYEENMKKYEEIMKEYEENMKKYERNIRALPLDQSGPFSLN